MSPRLKAIDDAVPQLQSLDKLLAKYDQLLNQLQQAARLIIRIDVAWPESVSQPSQPIFTLLPPK